MKKLSYYIIGLLVLAVVIIGYHYYAASETEEQIVQLIEEETAKSSAVSVTYSSVEVTPFDGEVSIRDLTIMRDHHIDRARRFTIDLSYFDVLKFYLGGTEYALKHLYYAEALLVKPSFVIKSNLQQLSSDSLHIYFEGQAFDGIRAAITDTSFSEQQSIRAEGSGLRVQFPQTLIAGLDVEAFQYHGSVDAGNKNFWSQGRHEVTMDSLTWTPVETFQRNYGFFIKGFGYPADAIPFQSAYYQSSPAPQSDMLRVESTLKSELAQVSIDGFLDLQQPLGASRLEEATISASEFSNSFRQVLENIEQLLSISLPRNDNGNIFIPLEGTLSEPDIAR
ncbi:MAG TPA: hypothetical protein VK074_01850 [Fodinibius sp.]|nr:hypothetical protein [Fodinibius sp.]